MNATQSRLKQVNAPLVGKRSTPRDKRGGNIT